MSRALEGDKTAYGLLLEKVAGMVSGYLMNCLGYQSRQPQKVEDLTQDVLVSIHKKKHLYDPSRPILPWIFAIARYRLIDAARADARRPRLVALEEGLEPRPPQSDVAPGSFLELEEILEGGAPGPLPAPPGAAVGRRRGPRR
jgi:RNA polymerase sigma-70 factor (ECF subfamily)